MESNKLILPGAIIIAGILIGGAIYLSGKNDNANNPSDQVESITEIEITEKDHIFGNANAEIKLVEFADPQCHFCRDFHPTMKRIMSEYGADGRVAWVYKHFIIFGEESEKQATATECAGELGGKEKFWNYLDALFAAKDENARLLPGKTVEGIASEVGLDAEQFSTCLNSGKYKDLIASWRDQAIAAGGKGTPYTLIVDKDGKILLPISGAQPYENVKAILDQALAGN